MNTKLIAALVIIGVLAITAVGLVTAQIATPTPTSSRSTPNGAAGNFFGWMGRCLGFRGIQIGPLVPCIAQTANITATNPNTGQTSTYQGDYGHYSGHCMRGFST